MVAKVPKNGNVDDALDVAQDALKFRPRPAQAANDPSIVDEAVGAVNKTSTQAGVGFLDKVEGLGMMALMAGPAIGKGIATGVSKIGGVLGLTSVQKAGDKAHGAITAFTEKTVEETFSGNAAAKKIGEGATKVTALVGDRLNDVGEVTRINRFAPRWSKWRAESHYNKMTTRMGELDVAKLPTSLRSHAENLLNITKQPHVGAINAEKFEAAHKAFAEAVEKVKPQGAEKAALKTFGKFIKSAESAVASHSNSVNLSGIGNFIKQVPKGIAKAPVLSGVMNAAFIVTSVLGLIGVGREAVKTAKSLKEMDADITGKKLSDVSLTSDVPKAIADDRRKLIENTAVSGAAATAGIALNVANAASGKVGVVSFFIPQIFSAIGSTIIGESTLPYYKELKAAHKAGEKIPPEAYANLAGIASKELKLRGGADSVFAKELGKIYAAENVSPEQLMREANDGTMMKRVKEIMAANAAAKHTAHIPEAPAKSHVAALSEPAKAVLPEKERPVIGEHTSKVAAENEAAIARGGA